MPISNTPRFQDLQQLTPLNEHEKNNTKGGYSFSCEEKKRGLMRMTICDDAGIVMLKLNGITARVAGIVMETYDHNTFSIASLRTM